ncbi:hypothetical protein [Halostagnicola bangensis]
MAVEQAVGIRDAENEAFTSAMVGALIAGAAFGLLLHETGRMESVAALYGQDGVHIGWLIHTAHSIFAGVFFLGVITLLSATDLPGVGVLERYAGFPTVTALAGVVYGLMLWGVFVATLMPLWGFAVGLERPLPYVHQPSLVGLVIFGGILGVVYGVLFRVLTRLAG